MLTLNKNLFILVSLLLFASCSSTKKQDIDLSKGTNELHLVPRRNLTTKCVIVLEGQTDCDFILRVSTREPIYFKKGAISYARGYECFDSGMKLKFDSEGCTEKSNLQLSYKFSVGYFGAYD